MELLRKSNRTNEENRTAERALSRINLSNMDLRDCDFSGLCICRPQFQGSQMTGCKFVRSALTMANFTGAKLDGADFTGAYLENVNFHNAIAIHLIFHRVIIRGGVFTNADVSFTHFDRTVFFRSYTECADFTDAITVGVSMTRIKDPKQSIKNLKLVDQSYLRSIRDRANLNQIARYIYLPPDMEREISLYMI